MILSKQFTFLKQIKVDSEIIRGPIYLIKIPSKLLPRAVDQDQYKAMLCIASIL